VGAGLLIVSASNCNGVAGCDVVTPTSSRSSPQQGQSVASGAVTGVAGVVRSVISRETLGRRPILHGNIFRVSVATGRCQQSEIRAMTDRILLLDSECIHACELVGCNPLTTHSGQQISQLDIRLLIGQRTSACDGL
jgi:hypothetical protein